MRAGRRWLAFDADFFFNPFITRLTERFGPAGPVVFIAFLCACKRSANQGTFSYTTEPEALILLGLGHIELVDPQGEKFTLEDVWKYAGTQKQTKRTRFGGRYNVKSTHWGAWQKNLRREENTQAKATNRSGHDADRPRTGRGQRRQDVDFDIETPPTPPRGERFASQGSNGNGQGNDQDTPDFVGIDRAAVDVTRATMRGDG
jgi:hypothetical protein